MPPEPSPPLVLLPGLAFADLYSAEGVGRLGGLFVAHLREADAGVATRLVSARANPESLSRKDESELLIAIGPHLEDFLARLFGIEPDVRALEESHHELAPLYAVKRLFVQRKAMNAHKADVAATFDGPALRHEIEELLGEPFTELGFARAVTRWQQDEAANAVPLGVAARYAAWASHTEEGRAAHKGGFAPRASSIT